MVNTHNKICFHHFSGQLSGIWYIHSIVPPSSFSNSRTFSSKSKACIHWIVIPQPPHPSSWKPLIFLPPCCYLIWIFLINGLIQHVASCVWCLTLSIIFSGFIHVVAYIRTSFFLWLSNIPLYRHATCCLSIHQLMDKYESKSLSVMSNSLRPCGLYGPWNSPGQNTSVGNLSFLQGIFPTQGSNSGLLHCKWILYQLSHKGSPNNISLYRYTTFCLSIHQLTDKCFHLLTLINSATVNIHVQSFVCFQFSWGYT